MAKTDFKDVDHYIKSKPPTLRPVLEQVRKTIRKALPKTEEVISYQIPAYRLPEGLVIFFAGWSEHFSVYPASDHVVSQLKKELKGYEVSKGTIRFPLADGVPTQLIARIAQLRAQEVIERAKAKAKPIKPTSKAKPEKKIAKAVDDKPAKKVAKAVDDKPAKKVAKAVDDKPAKKVAKAVDDKPAKKVAKAAAKATKVEAKPVRAKAPPVPASMVDDDDEDDAPPSYTKPIVL